MTKQEKKTTRQGIQKRLASIAIFAMLATFLAYEEPTIEIAWVTAILLLTVYLFAFEIVDVDVAAFSIMVLLGLSDFLAPVMGLEKGLVDPKHLFDGFSSNAVISIVAVMIIGAGLDKTGLMSKVAAFILKNYFNNFPNAGPLWLKAIIRTVIAMAIGMLIYWFYYSPLTTFFLARVQGFAQPDDKSLVWVLLFLSIIMIQWEFFEGWPLKKGES